MTMDVEVDVEECPDCGHPSDEVDEEGICQHEMGEGWLCGCEFYREAR